MSRSQKENASNHRLLLLKSGKIITDEQKQKKLINIKQIDIAQRKKRPIRKIKLLRNTKKNVIRTMKIGFQYLYNG